MFLRVLFFACCISAAAADFDLSAPPHLYYEKEPRDAFTQLKTDLEANRLELDRTSEKAFLLSLLKALGIPASSQMLLFSTTSLQLSLITPSNPRALYFNENSYVGYVPGGRIEIVSLDPELGGIFHILEIPRGNAPFNVERSRRCMNCHSGSDTRFVPGLLIKSVIVGPKGGSLDAFRTEEVGHQVPFAERFGGWYLTGDHAFTNNWANAIGRTQGAEEIARQPVRPGDLFDFQRYPVPTSDPLPQLVHEHQAGFVNRVISAAYLAREFLHLSAGQLNPAQSDELDKSAHDLVRYMLFADEACLPAGGISGDAAYKADFLHGRRVASGGSSLKDFDLLTRLFKYRCSYMIYTPLFAALPAGFKSRVFTHLGNALHGRDPRYEYLPKAEREAILRILKETLNDTPAAW
jgi:hypothetical protein